MPCDIGSRWGNHRFDLRCLAALAYERQSRVRGQIQLAGLADCKAGHVLAFNNAFRQLFSSTSLDINFIYVDSILILSFPYDSFAHERNS